MASDSGKTIYKPGDNVEMPGIYRVVHREHRRPHETSFRDDEVFPICKKCGDKVRFELIQSPSDGKSQVKASRKQ